VLSVDGKLKSAYNDDAHGCCLYIWSDKPETCYKNNVVKHSGIIDSVAGSSARYINVSDLKGKYYIGFGMFGSGSYITLKRLKLTV
jgi:hypothetical protein